MLNIDLVGSILFGIAILHSFSVSQFIKFSHSFNKGSLMNALFHLLGEVEIVFGLWAGIFLVFFAFYEDSNAMISYQESLSFTEPQFVFVIMIIAATKPILTSCQQIILFVSSSLRKIFRANEANMDLFCILTLGPLAGSLITEPASMTVSALLLRKMIGKTSTKLLYFLIGVLFVNVSIGGVLTPYAAPPILMVVKAWGWDFNYIFMHLGWRCAVAVFMNALIFSFVFREKITNELDSLSESMRPQVKTDFIPIGIKVIHFTFLTLIVLTSHHSQVFMGIFLFFLGVTTVTKSYQDPLKFRESLLVAFFLGGIIVFGNFQKWWLQPLLSSLSETQLFFGAAALTSVTDNAALTYLGSQVVGLSDLSKLALVSGAIAGGGLTVIANAPNPAGYTLLADRFPNKVISPLKLFYGALFPTFVAIICLWYLP